MSFPGRLLGEDGSRDDAFTLTAGRLISYYMPEAVSQAVALCEITKHVLY